MGNYESVKRWRAANPEKYHEMTHNHYHRHSYGPNSYKRWEQDELDAITVDKGDRTDRELAKLLGRSLKSIHVMRAKMKRLQQQ